MKLSPQQHQADASIGASKGYPRGRFPIPDAGHARAALMDLKGAKGLSGSQKQMIRQKAIAKLGK